MIDVVYIDRNETNESAAARYPHILRYEPGGVRCIGSAPAIVFDHMTDPRAAHNAALRRFARGG